MKITSLDSASAWNSNRYIRTGSGSDRPNTQLKQLNTWPDAPGSDVVAQGKLIPYARLASLVLVASIVCLFNSQLVVGQTEKLGDIKFTAPRGWTKSAQENAVTFSEIDQKAGKFCIITLYAATSSTGNPQADFAREWNNLVVKKFGAEPNPKTGATQDDGWIATGGGAPIDLQGTKAFAFLTVASGFGKTVSILALLNDDAYLVALQSFVEGMDIDKTSTRTANTAPTAVPALQYDDFGRLLIPLPSRQLTMADLAGQWGESEGINVRYVDRYSGTYAGADSLHYKTKMTFTAGGGYFDDFYAIQNGKLIKEKAAGAVAVNGRILVIKTTNLQKYVIRGWLELPDMTILEVCGPWYNDDVIPQEIFLNPVQGANLNKKWVRKK
jgi:hypothetical protein